LFCSIFIILLPGIRIILSSYIILIPGIHHTLYIILDKMFVLSSYITLSTGIPASHCKIKDLYMNMEQAFKLALQAGIHTSPCWQGFTHHPEGRDSFITL
jgi:hypothetical protein